jgi:glycosyltransferase involved in cell wall biosynthesis
MPEMTSMPAPAGVGEAAPPRVLLVTGHASIGGIEQVVVSIARHLGERGWPIEVAVPLDREAEAFAAWAQAQGVTVHAHRELVPHYRSRGWRDAAALRRVVRSYRPEVVNLHVGATVSAKEVLALRLAVGGRTAISFHDPDLPRGRVGLQTRLGVRTARRLVANSNATAEMLARLGAPAGRVERIFCGVEAPAVLPTRKAARAELGIASNAFVIGSGGRLARPKGYDELIEAVAGMGGERVPPLLVIGGEGRERAALEVLAAERLGERARFLGRVASLHTLYAASDVFALASHHEGFGLVYVEAALHGVPSVGYAHRGVPDAVQDERTGLLATVGDVAGLTRRLERLQDDEELRSRLGAAARQRALGELSAARMADRYAEVFRAVAGRG